MHIEIRHRKWRWVVYTLRKHPSNVTRHALDWNPQGNGNKGAQNKHRSGAPRMNDLRPISLMWELAKRYATGQRK